MIKIKHPEIDENELLIFWRHRIPNQISPKSIISKRADITVNNGTTTCTLALGKRETVVSTGVATTSIKDQFNRKVGRKLALTRALAQTSYSKELRQVVWDTYHQTEKSKTKTTEPQTS